MNGVHPIPGADIRPPGAATVIKTVHAAAGEQGVPYLVVGAAGRDLLLEHVYGSPSPTATRDVDFGVMVEGWAEYDALKARLLERHGYTPTRTLFRVVSPEGLLVDLVPFGGVEDPEGEVALPPRRIQVMVTLGFEEAYQHATQIEIDGVGPIRVASLAGMSVLKLLAWRDRREERDAEDVALLMREYYDLQADAVYARHADLFDEDDFDTAAASARVLGRDAGRLSAGSTALRATLEALLERELDESRSASSLALSMGGRYGSEYERWVRNIGAYLRGFREGSGAEARLERE